jgi:hypothetical protein
VKNLTVVQGVNCLHEEHLAGVDNLWVTTKTEKSEIERCIDGDNSYTRFEIFLQRAREYQRHSILPHELYIEKIKLIFLLTTYFNHLCI